MCSEQLRSSLIRLARHSMSPRHSVPIPVQMYVHCSVSSTNCRSSSSSSSSCSSSSSTCSSGRLHSYVAKAAGVAVASVALSPMVTSLCADGDDDSGNGKAPTATERTRRLGASGPQYICACRLSTDFFVHGVDRYYDYDGSDEKFFTRYQKEVDQGILTVDQLTSILEEVKKQGQERVGKLKRGADVHEHIAAHYKPLHPDLREFREEFLHPSFLDIVRRCRELGIGPFDRDALTKAGFEVIKDISTQTTGVVTIKHVFTEDFCERLTEELLHFADSGLEYTRPNTMNRNGGVLLYELGFQRFLDRFTIDYMNPVCKTVVPDDFRGGELDAHKVFTVAYQAHDCRTFDALTGKRQTTLRSEGPTDVKLSVHTDNAEATLNLHLAGDWTGGDLNVYGKGSSGNYLDDRMECHVPERRLAFSRDGKNSRGLALFHAGSEFHEALGVTSGWRLNMIMWFRSSKVRNEACPMCNKAPRLVEIDSLAGEGFTSPPCTVIGAL